jgi:hypothetical protein
MIGYLAYGAFQHKLVFFGVAKIGSKKAYLIMLTPFNTKTHGGVLL